MRPEYAGQQDAAGKQVVDSGLQVLFLFVSWRLVISAGIL